MQSLPLHPAAQTYAASSIQRITVPPCVLPPQLTSVGAARKRSVAWGARLASV